MTVKLSIEKDGNLQFSKQALDQALLSQGNTVGKLSSLAAIRRHLGWTVAVELEPKSEVTEKQAAQAVERPNTLRPHLAKLPFFKSN